MTKNAKSDKTFFLENLQELLKKEYRSRSFTNILSKDGLKSNLSSNNIKNSSEPPLPPVSDALLSLLTHLVDLESRVSKAEERGQLRPFSEIGAAIKDARKRQGLTVEALAELADVAPATIHKIEKGSIQVHASKLAQVAETLGIELLVSAT